MLREHGREVTASDRRNGGLSIYAAASTGCEEMVEFLLNTPGVEVDSEDFCGRTPSFFCC